MSSISEKLWAETYHKVATRPVFIANALTNFADQGGLDEAQLAAHFGLDLTGLYKLGIHRWPYDYTKLTQIAHNSGVAPYKLQSLYTFYAPNYDLRLRVEVLQEANSSDSPFKPSVLSVSLELA